MRGLESDDKLNMQIPFEPKHNIISTQSMIHK